MKNRVYLLHTGEHSDDISDFDPYRTRAFDSQAALTFAIHDFVGACTEEARAVNWLWDDVQAELDEAESAFSMAEEDSEEWYEAATKLANIARQAFEVTVIDVETRT